MRSERFGLFKPRPPLSSRRRVVTKKGLRTFFWGEIATLAFRDALVVRSKSGIANDENTPLRVTLSCLTGSSPTTPWALIVSLESVRREKNLVSRFASLTSSDRRETPCMPSEHHVRGYALGKRCVHMRQCNVCTRGVRVRPAAVLFRECFLDKLLGPCSAVTITTTVSRK